MARWLVQPSVTGLAPTAAQLAPALSTVHITSLGFNRAASTLPSTVAPSPHSSYMASSM
jgi:hypothetical protein